MITNNATESGAVGQFSEDDAAGTMLHPMQGRHFRDFTTLRPSLSERLATGKALRREVPRTAHARYVADPV
ncbi:hypothetical protein WBP07_21375 (plasmid) [Novosphingobium sp. BL-8A]|uniref:hypothetical protein n=1 Tax=Novosphingobium sp. BL-8A TaxID=3127639 RepID=UPI0037566B8C